MKTFKVNWLMYGAACSGFIKAKNTAEARLIAERGLSTSSEITEISEVDAKQVRSFGDTCINFFNPRLREVSVFG